MDNNKYVKGIDIHGMYYLEEKETIPKEVDISQLNGIVIHHGEMSKKEIKKKFGVVVATYHGRGH